MTASTEQPRAFQRGERRIIERPRLIKLLDESEARIILLLAPAGYGKTTLARQWFKTLNGAIWISLTPAHRDIAKLCHELAIGIGEGEFFRTYLGALSNPQRAPLEIARELATRLDSAGVQWVVLDDYHEAGQAPEIDEFAQEIEARAAARMLVASRARPGWATARRAIYGDIEVIDHGVLAMTDREANLVLGHRADVSLVVEQSAGWPAVLGLAAASGMTPPSTTFPDALYEYFAEELFKTATLDLQEHLFQLALSGEMELQGATKNEGAGRTFQGARELGFLGSGDEGLHPLIREFLLAKLAARPDADARARHAIDGAAADGNWDRAFDLALRFQCRDLVPSLIEQAYRPLTNSGRIGSLVEFARRGRTSSGFPPPVVELVEAEVALRDGDLDVAAAVARRVLDRMPREHPLYSRSATILGQASFLRTAFSDAASAYSIAEATAQSDRDETEALHGFAVAAIFGETRRDEARRAVKRLAERKTRSPTDLVRYSIMDIARKRFDEGYAEALEIGDILRLLHLVDDPRVRTSFLYTCANALALRSEYDSAKKLIDPLMEDIEQFSLDFARPYANWTQALVALGRRRFGEAERLLQTVEDVATTTGDPGHHVNARSLRARLLLQTQQQAQALRLVSEDPPSAVMPSWKGEYFATRALAAACVGDARESAQAAKAASAHSTAIEVRVLGACARAIVGADTGETDLALAAWEQSRLVGGWDLLLTALRSAPAFANAIVARPATHAELEHLLTRSYDRSLAKRLGLRPRATRAPREVLSPREFEILGLIRRGLRTKEIAEALFISESTTKVHVRHIFEKLGVRTRAEAVARYEMFTDT